MIEDGVFWDMMSKRVQSLVKDHKEQLTTIEDIKKQIYNDGGLMSKIRATRLQINSLTIDTSYQLKMYIRLSKRLERAVNKWCEIPGCTMENSFMDSTVSELTNKEANAYNELTDEEYAYLDQLNELELTLDSQVTELKLLEGQIRVCKKAIKSIMFNMNTVNHSYEFRKISGGLGCKNPIAVNLYSYDTENQTTRVIRTVYLFVSSATEKIMKSNHMSLTYMQEASEKEKELYLSYFENEMD